MHKLKFNLPKLQGRKTLSKFKQNQDGATAVEFAILGLPFAALLFGIIEVSLLFFLTSTTEHALAEVSREIRTGEFQGSGGGADELKVAICANMHGIGNCNNLRVDVISTATGQFSDLVLPVSPPACAGPPAAVAACEAATPSMPADNYSITSSGDVVIVRVQYVHRLEIPSALTGLANSTGNTHVISATTAFRNEPF